MKKVFKWMRRILGYGFLLIVTFVGLLAVYVIYFPWEDRAIERSFNRKLKDKISSGEDKIYLRDLTDFEWDRVCYFKTNRDFGMSNYPTPSEVLGRKYNGYVPMESCDTMSHNDLLFSNSSSAHFIQVKRCMSDNLCRTETFHKDLHCCSKNAYIEKRQYERSNSGVFYFRYFLNELTQ